MLIDLTLPLTKDLTSDAQGNERKVLTGHLGTHFDVMNREFPLSYLRRDGIVFDISPIRDREIQPSDIGMNEIRPDMFVAFFSGFSDEVPYGSRPYFKEHPQLSQKLIWELVDRKISVIGIDFAGVRRGKEHTPADQFCADHGVFIVENLYGLSALLQYRSGFTVYTFPLRHLDWSGLPCRVVAEISDERN